MNERIIPPSEYISEAIDDSCFRKVRVTLFTRSGTNFSGVIESVGAFVIVDPSDKHKQDQTAYIPIDYVECFVEHGE